MQVPVRLVAVLRPQLHGAVLAAVGVATVVFSASPFLIDEVADHYELGLSSAALISTAQLGGFGVASFGAGRTLNGRPHVFVVAAGGLVLVNLASALVPPFPVLVALRAGAGLTMGVTSWMAWSLAFGDDADTSEVSMVGPLVGVVAAPVIAPVVQLGGINATYLMLSAWAAVPLVLAGLLSIPEVPAVRAESASGATGTVSAADRTRHRPVPVALVILISLALFSAGGSSVWMFTAVFGEERGISITVLAWAYSANAVAGVISARWPSERGPAGLWVAGTGALALLVCVYPNATAQLVAMALWGFFFWMGLPAAFSLLAAKSRYPEERAGDAHAYLAAGRVLGPTIGGLALDYGGATALGLLAAALMMGAGLMLVVTARTGNKHTEVGVL